MLRERLRKILSISLNVDKPQIKYELEKNHKLLLIFMSLYDFLNTTLHYLSIFKNIAKM